MSKKRERKAASSPRAMRTPHCYRLSVRTERALKRVKDDEAAGCRPCIGVIGSVFLEPLTINGGLSLQVVSCVTWYKRHGTLLFCIIDDQL